MNIPEVDKYNYLGITINQSLKLKDHKNKMRTFERCIGPKTKLLGRILERMKGKMLNFKALFRSRLNYEVDPLIKHNPKYQAKWESMLYRVTKGLLGIKFNVKKSVLLN